MPLATDFYGHTFDDATPSFVNVGPNLYYHRPSGRYLDKASVDAKMTDAGYTAPAAEVGDAEGWAERQLGVGQPQSAGEAGPLDASNSGGGTTTRRITIDGGPADQAYTVTVTGLAVDGTAIDTSGVAVPVAAGDTEDDVAAALAAALDGTQDIGATITIAATAENDVVVLTADGSDPGEFDAGIAVNIAPAA